MSILEYFWIAFIAIEKYSSVAVFGGGGRLVQYNQIRTFFWTSLCLWERVSWDGARADLGQVVCISPPSLEHISHRLRDFFLSVSLQLLFSSFPGSNCRCLITLLQFESSLPGVAQPAFPALRTWRKREVGGWLSEGPLVLSRSVPEAWLFWGCRPCGGAVGPLRLWLPELSYGKAGHRGRRCSFVGADVCLMCILWCSICCRSNINLLCK